MKQYAVTLIGCGHMGRVHLEQLRRMDHIRLRAVADTDVAKAKELQRLYHAECFFTDWRQAVADPETDIVIIATYPSSHVAMLRECVRLGKHVLCEKPVAACMEEVEEFLQLMQNGPVKVLAGYILRHNHSYQRVKELIEEGVIGFPILMRMTQNHHTMDWPRYRSLILESSPLVDCGVHYVDVMEWMTGAAIERIQAVGACTEGDLPRGRYNYGLLTARLSDGSTGIYEAGWGNTICAQNVKEFIGPKGRIRLVLQNDRENHQEEGDMIEIYCYPEQTYQIQNVLCERKPAGEQLDYLIQMMEDGAPPVPSADEIRRGMIAVLEADRQIQASL